MVSTKCHYSQILVYLLGREGLYECKDCVQLQAQSEEIEEHWVKDLAYI